jgi:hypothetical protein
MMPARREIDRPGRDRLAIRRFAHRRLDRARQVLGENGGEGGRHVLRDQHRRARDQAAAVCQHGLERLRSASRRADQQDARRRQRHRPQWNWLLRPCGTIRRRLAARLSRALAERADLLDQFAAEIVGRVGIGRRRRLRDVVGRTERERLEADLGIPPRHRRRHDDDEVALAGEQLRQRGDAVQLRHLDVEDNNVGIGAPDFIDRVAAGAQQRYNIEVGFGRHPAREQPAHDGGIIHDHDAQALARGGIERRRCGEGVHRGVFRRPR